MSNTSTLSPCVVINWSADTSDARGATLIICSIAIVFHIVFWIQIFLYRSVRQRGMIWLYIYLLTDFFLLFRFFLFYSQRIRNTCVPRTARTYLCYFEAISKIYTNVIQSYILLGLNICRYVQIVYNRNVYIKDIRLIIIANIIIYLFPMINIVFQFLVNWTQLWRKVGGLCDIKYLSIYVQIYNLIIVYFIPVSLNVLFLILCIRYIMSGGNIQNQQIRNNRRKFHRMILNQSIMFYTIWIILWSPFVLSYQFINTNSVGGIITSTLNYIQVAIDPAILTVIDKRFLKAWKNTFKKFLRKRQRQIQPNITKKTLRKY